tara:strand:- start:27 stop:344 length:318 start_codon:yes stop_codon:yes gene_type:complete
MKEINPVELKKMMDDKEQFQLIDIRDQYEIDLCSIGGKCINFYHILDKKDEISKDKKVIIYCRTGNRSLKAIRILERKFKNKNLYNLKGGILQWREDIDPSLPTY